MPQQEPNIHLQQQYDDIDEEGESQITEVDERKESDNVSPPANWRIYNWTIRTWCIIL